MVSLDQTENPVSRQERIAVLVIVLAGCVLRCLFLSDVAVEHFDEGVYASNLWFGSEQGAEYPGRYFYAPPLFPFLIEWSMIFLGSGVWGVFLPALLLGSLTVLLIWWVARSWFGPAAGLVAAILASGSDLHLLYSRAALTDIALGFFLLLSVYLIWRSYLSQDWKWPVLAGAAIGLGWSIKYNGWLPLAIAFSGIIPWLWVTRRARQPLSHFLTRGLVFTLVACLVWSPVLIGLQKWGGYSVVAANHSRYVVGFSGWWDSCSRQLLNHRLLEGPPGFLSLGFVCFVGCLLGLSWHGQPTHDAKSAESNSESGRFTWNTILIGLLAAVPLLGVWLLGVTPVSGFLAATGILLQLFVNRKPVSAEQDSNAAAQTLAAWLLAAWFCGLLLATPLYYPYPRLTIPWMMSAWLGIAALIGWLEQRCGGSLIQIFSRQAGAVVSIPRLLSAVSPVIVAMVLVLISGPWSVAAWQTRTGLADISRQILADLQRDDANAADAILYIYAEPGLFFNLKAQGHQLTGPVADFQFLNSLPPQVPVYLIAGPHADQDPAFREQFAAVHDRLEQVHSYDYSASLLVRLNQSELVSKDTNETVTVYRAR